MAITRRQGWDVGAVVAMTTTVKRRWWRRTIGMAMATAMAMMTTRVKMTKAVT